MWKRIGYFALGVVSAPIVLAVTRTAIRGLVRSGVYLVEYATRFGAGVTEDIQDIAAEARTSGTDSSESDTASS